MPKIKTIGIDGFDYIKDQWNVELSEGVVALIGPNGSGKTTLLDSLRSSMGLSQFGDRNLSKYIRQEGVIAIIYDNTPDSNGSRPFREVIHTDDDTITVVQKFKRGPRSPERGFYIIGGDFDPKNGTLPPAKEILGVEAFMSKMQKVGFSDAYLKILGQPQGQIWSLLSQKPHELLTSLLDITGDQMILEKLKNAIDKVAKAKAEQQQIALEVATSKINHTNLEREKESLDNYKTWVEEKAKNQVMSKLATLNGFTRTRTSCISGIGQYTKNIKGLEDELIDQRRLKTDTLKKKVELEKQRKEALEQRGKADRQRVEIAEQVNHLKIDIGVLEQQLKEVEGLPKGTEGELKGKAAEIQGHLNEANSELNGLKVQLNDLKAELEVLKANQTYYPDKVRMARRELERQGIPYRQVSDVIEIIDPTWSAAIEAYLGPNRFAFIIDAQNRDELLRAKRILRHMKYPYWCAKPKPVSLVADKDSVLAKISIPEDILGYFSNLNRIKRVSTEDEAERYADERGMESLAADGYHTYSDSRSRVLGIDRAQYCGQNTREQRKKTVESTILSLQPRISGLEQETQTLSSSLQTYLRAIQLLPFRENNPPKIALLKEQLDKLTQLSAIAQHQYEEADLQWQAIHAEQLEVQKEETTYTESIQQKENELDRQKVLKTTTEETLKKNHEDIEQLQRQLSPADMELLSSVQYEARIYDDNVKRLDRQISYFKNDEASVKLLDKMETIERLVQNSAKRLALSEQNMVARQKEIEKAERVYQTCLEDYRQHIKHIFAVLDQRLQQKASEYGIRTTLRSRLKEDGEVTKDEVELKVAFDDKALASYQTGDLSGGQKTVVSILLIMAAVQASAEINGQQSGNIDFLIFDEPAASLDSHWFEEVGRFFQKSGLQIILTAPEDEKLRNSWWVNQGIFTALKKSGERYAPPLDIVKFVPEDVACTEEESC